MGSKFWLCWVEGTDGGFHYKHETLESAQAEAERLSKMQNIGERRVYILEAIEYCQVEYPPVVHHTL